MSGLMNSSDNSNSGSEKKKGDISSALEKAFIVKENSPLVNEFARMFGALTRKDTHTHIYILHMLCPVSRTL